MTTIIPDDILAVAENTLLAAKINNRPAASPLPDAIIERHIAFAILAERERCAQLADNMKVKHGSPVLGPYENGVWDQGARIASLIRRGV